MIFKEKNKIILKILLIFFGFFIPFFVGSFFGGYQVEGSAEYVSRFIGSNGLEGDYLAVKASPSKSANAALPDSSSEFHNLYGVFKQRNITFASMINTEHEYNISLSCDPEVFLSFLYVGPIGSVEYNNHFKHYIYPIETMFEDSNHYDAGRYCVYISESQAIKLLKSKGIKKDSYFLKDFEGLIGSLFEMNVGSSVHRFVVQNIFYETNYYFNGIYETFGDFMVCSYYLPEDIRNTQENVYFLNGISYQNEYFMKYLRSSYDKSVFQLEINHYNLKTEIDEEKVLNFYNDSSNNSKTSIAFMVVIFSCILLVISLGIRIEKGTVAFVSVAFIPYLFFSVLSNLFGFYFLFSNFSRKFFIFQYLAFFVFLICVNKLPKKKKTEISYYETISI